MYSGELLEEFYNLMRLISTLKIFTEFSSVLLSKLAKYILF